MSNRNEEKNYPANTSGRKRGPNKEDSFFNLLPFGHVLESIDDFFRHSLLKPGFSVNVKETEHTYMVTAELPGVKKENISIRLMENSLTITAKQTEVYTQEDDLYKYYEKKTSVQQLSRTIPFYHPINEKNAKASYQNGLLKVTVYKKLGKKLKIEDI